MKTKNLLIMVMTLLLVGTINAASTATPRFNQYPDSTIENLNPNGMTFATSFVASTDRSQVVSGNAGNLDHSARICSGSTLQVAPSMSATWATRGVAGIVMTTMPCNREGETYRNRVCPYQVDSGAVISNEQIRWLSGVTYTSLQSVASETISSGWPGANTQTTYDSVGRDPAFRDIGASYYADEIGGIVPGLHVGRANMFCRGNVQITVTDSTGAVVEQTTAIINPSDLRVASVRLRTLTGNGARTVTTKLVGVDCMGIGINYPSDWRSATVGTRTYNAIDFRMSYYNFAEPSSPFNAADFAATSKTYTLVSGPGASAPSCMFETRTPRVYSSFRTPSEEYYIIEVPVANTAVGTQVTFTGATAATGTTSEYTVSPADDTCITYALRAAAAGISGFRCPSSLGMMGVQNGFNLALDSGSTTNLYLQVRKTGTFLGGRLIANITGQGPAVCGAGSSCSRLIELTGVLPGAGREECVVFPASGGLSIVPQSTETQYNVSCYRRNADGLPVQISCTGSDWSTSEIAGLDAGTSVEIRRPTNTNVNLFTNSLHGTGMLDYRTPGAAGASCRVKFDMGPAAFTDAVRCEIQPPTSGFGPWELGLFQARCFNAAGAQVTCPGSRSSWTSNIPGHEFTPDTDGILAKMYTITGNNNGQINYSFASPGGLRSCVADVTITPEPLYYFCGFNPATAALGVGQSQRFDLGCFDVSVPTPAAVTPSRTEYDAVSPLIGFAHNFDNTGSNFTGTAESAGDFRGIVYLSPRGNVVGAVALADVNVVRAGLEAVSCTLTPPLTRLGPGETAELSVRCQNLAGTEVPCPWTGTSTNWVNEGFAGYFSTDSDNRIGHISVSPFDAGGRSGRVRYTFSSTGGMRSCSAELDIASEPLYYRCGFSPNSATTRIGESRRYILKCEDVNTGRGINPSRAFYDPLSPLIGYPSASDLSGSNFTGTADSRGYFRGDARLSPPHGNLIGAIALADVTVSSGGASDIVACNILPSTASFGNYEYNTYTVTCNNSVGALIPCNGIDWRLLGLSGGHAYETEGSAWFYLLENSLGARGTVEYHPNSIHAGVFCSSPITVIDARYRCELDPRSANLHVRDSQFLNFRCYVASTPTTPSSYRYTVTPQIGTTDQETARGVNFTATVFGNGNLIGWGQLASSGSIPVGAIAIAPISVRLNFTLPCIGPTCPSTNVTPPCVGEGCDRIAPRGRSTDSCEINDGAAIYIPPGGWVLVPIRCGPARNESCINPIISILNRDRTEVLPGLLRRTEITNEREELVAIRISALPAATNGFTGYVSASVRNWIATGGGVCDQGFALTDRACRELS